MQKPILYSLALIAFVLQTTASPTKRAPSNNLVENSPFLPPGFPPIIVTTGPNNGTTACPKPPQIKPKLTFKGYVRHQGVWKFSILEQKTGKTKWLRKNQLTSSGLLITDFNPDTEVVQYTYKEVKGELPLVAPKR